MSVFVVNRPLALPPRLLTEPGHRACLALVASLAIVMSATGACDTDDLAPAHRTGLWLLISALVIWQSVALRHWLANYVKHPAITIALAVVATVVLTAIQLHALKYTPVLPKAPDPPLAFVVFLFPLVSPIALLAIYLASSRPAVPTRQQQAPGRSAKVTCRSLDSWPDQRVLRVSAQDHYLSIQTEHGVLLIRGRMRDALAKLNDSDGLQVHRSHWIADTQIARMTRRGRDYRVHLLDGTSVPVSRARVTDLKRHLSASKANVGIGNNR